MKTLYTAKFLELLQEGPWEYVQRRNATGAAVIVAVTYDEKLVLVEQYRTPVHAWTIELPAGVIGDDPSQAAESKAEAARRELLEETGYAAELVEPLMTGAASSGLCSELITFFRATNLRRMHAGGGVAHEKITVHEVPLKDIDNWLTARQAAGTIVDPKIFAGLYLIGQS